MIEICMPKIENREEAEALGLSTRTRIKCMGCVSSIVFDGDVEKAFVKDDDEDTKTYAIWFREGGAIELVIKKGCLELWDSYGVDIGICFGEMVVRSHKPGGDRANWETAHAVFSG